MAAVAENPEGVEPVEWFVLNAEANVEVDLTGVDALDQETRFRSTRTSRVFMHTMSVDGAIRLPRLRCWSTVTVTIHRRRPDRRAKPWPLICSRVDSHAEIGHKRETNRGGHDVRRRASPQFNARRLDTEFEMSRHLI